MNARIFINTWFLYHSSGRYQRLALALVLLVAIGHIASAEHEKKDHHKKHEELKKHESHDAKKHEGKAHKKAEIDFSNSEFADSDSTDDTPDDDQAEQGIKSFRIGLCFLLQQDFSSFLIKNSSQIFD